MRALARLVVWGLAVVAGAPAWADAEIVHWSTGRTLSVRSHRIDGDSVTLVLHAGGEITCPARLVVRVEPDEATPVRGCDCRSSRRHERSGRRDGAAGPRRPVRGLDRPRGAPA